MAQPAGKDSSILPVDMLRGRARTSAQYTPDEAALDQIAQELGLISLRKCSLSGEITPEGRDDWLLRATLGATAVQPCSVTLAPVKTRVDQIIERRFVKTMPDAREDEADEDGVPIHEDDTLELLGREIDLHAVLTEALALALPDYPRADGAALGEAVFSAPGTTPMRDEDARPFAGLAALRNKLDSAD